MPEFVADGGKFTLENGVLEFWAGGASWGRFRIEDIAPLYLNEMGGRVRVGVSPGPTSVVTYGSKGIQADFSDRTQLDAFLAAIQALRGSG
ncbi:MAG TPA: hypothetical protein VNC78_11670 [Actinomycetota bacterium]|nr:hypothetical protein [Actinomycetota bacterium]